MKDPRSFDESTFEPIRRKRGRNRPPARAVARRNLPNCKGKRSYWTHQDAESTRSSVLKFSQTHVLRVYHCNRCPYWHLTSQSPRTRR